ncbi:MAG TPA: PspC domain-containing protein, partial [Bacteroidota bacterium]|nr:PspC domain-containing protein [Bacteroidota bacterium]
MTNDQNGPRRLYKSRRIRMIDGICGGIAEYFGVDVTIIRLLFVLLGFMGGTGLLVYIAAMIIMPANPDFSSVPEQNGRQGNGRRFWGIALILAGAAVLMVNLGWLAGYDWWSPSGTVILPIIMIGAGIFIVIGLRGRRQPAGDAPAAGTGDFAVRQEPAREL